MIQQEWVAHDYYLDDVSAPGVSLWAGFDTSVPLTKGTNAFGEPVWKRGAREVYLQGMGFHTNEWGNRVHASDYDVTARYLDSLKHRGINSVSIFMPDAYGGTIASGSLAGRPRGVFVSETVAANPPTSNEYNDLFWTGQPGAGPGVPGAIGMDRFMTMLAERGMYAFCRFDWPQIHTRYGATVGNKNPKYQGLWWLPGLQGEPDMRSITTAHLLTFFNRVNSITGKTYGQDTTICVINPFNEFGLMRFRQNTSSASDPTTETFDSLVKEGGASAKYVTAFDAYFVAWHTAYYGYGPKWGAADAAITAIPCHAYSGAAGAGVAARPSPPFTTNVGDATRDGQRKRLMKFFEEQDREMHESLSATLAAVCPHALYSAGQSNYVGYEGNKISPINDTHVYAGGGSVAGNYDSNPDQYDATFAWSGGVVTVTLSVTPTAPLTVGVPMLIAMDPAFNGNSTIVMSNWYPGKVMSSGYYVYATDGTIWKAANAGTCSLNGRGPNGAGATFVDGGVTFNKVQQEIVTVTNVDSATVFRAATATSYVGAGRVIAPAGGSNAWYMHRDPAVDISATVVPAVVNGVAQDIVVPGIVGTNTTYCGSTAYQWITTGTLADKLRVNTESGRRGVWSIPSEIHMLDYTINDLLMGGNGSILFTAYGAPSRGAAGEHFLEGHATPWLMMELNTLIARNAKLHPCRDPAYTQKVIVTRDTVDDWYAGVGITNSGTMPGWRDFVSNFNFGYPSWIVFGCKWDVGPSAVPQVGNCPNVQLPEYPIGWARDPEDLVIDISVNTGWQAVSTPWFASWRGRLDGAGRQVGCMHVKPTDGKHWYGHVTVVSENGMRLDAPGCKARLYQWGGLGQSAGASIANFGPIGSMNFLHQEGAYGPDNWLDIGLMPRKGLDIRIIGPNTIRARRLTRGTWADVPTGYREGAAWLRCDSGRLFLTMSARALPAPRWLQSSPPAGQVGIGYTSYQFVADDVASYSLGSGALPPGLTLSSAGLLSGTPTLDGDYAFTVNATNATGTTASPALSVHVASLAATMVLDFTVDGTLPAGFTASRVTTGTGASAVRCKADGTFEAVADNLPRWEYDRNTHAMLGVLNEGSGATNLLLNTDAGSGQGVAVTSGTAYTLSFYAGTGVSVTWSGAASGGINGLGATIRQRVTITPGSTGTLTFTIVGGAVDHWQFEAGSYPSNYAKSGSGQAVRGGEKLNYVTMAVPNYNTSEGTWYAEYGFGEPSSGQKIFCISDASNSLSLTVNYQGKVTASTSKSGTQNLDSTIPTAPNHGQIMRVAYAYDATTGRISAQGGAVMTAAQDNTFTPTRVAMGNASNIGAGITGLTVRYLRKLVYYPVKRSDADLIALSNGSLSP